MIAALKQGLPVVALDVGYGASRIVRSTKAALTLKKDPRVYRRDLPWSEAVEIVDRALDEKRITRGAHRRKMRRLRRRGS